MKQLAFLLFLGCATVGEVRHMDGQEQAVYVIWKEVYGRNDRPPLIRWMTGKQLVCTDPTSGKPGFWIPNSSGPWECREGLTMSPLECMVAYHGETTFSETALAHELMHVKQARELVFDSEHTRPEWSLVAVANQAVLEAGR